MEVKQITTEELKQRIKVEIVAHRRIILAGLYDKLAIAGIEIFPATTETIFNEILE